MLFFAKILTTNIFFFIWGKFFSKFLLKTDEISRSEIGIYGTAFVSFLAILLNFFLPLNEILNSLLLILTFMLLFKYKLFSKSDIFFIIISTFLVCLIIAYSNINTPDAGLYHLPYTQILNENKIIIGVNNLHFRFGHISIIQYLSAINFNIFTGINGILIPLASSVVFVILYFFEEIYKFIKSNSDLSLNHLFCLFILCFIAYKINRYSGFGNDAIAHILLFYLISIFLKTKFDYVDIQKTAIISTFIFLNKVTLILAFFIPFLIFLKCKENKIKIFYSFSTILLFIWILKNVLTSSCLIYPLEITCFDNLKWSNKTELRKQSISSEAWAKGWPDRFNKDIDQKIFIDNFNWLDAWSSKHLKYIIKILFPYLIFIFLISIILNFIKERNKSIKFTLKKNDHFKVISLFLMLILGNLLFFLKFPLFRYGYSYTISFISLIVSLSIFSFQKNIIKKTFLIILIMAFVILILKQVIRIKENFKIKNIWPNIKSFSIDQEIQKFETKKLNKNFIIYVSDKECMYVRSPCTNNFNQNISHKNIYGFDLIYKKK